MALVIALALGFALGLVVRGWWAVAAARVPWVWISATTDVDEVPHWFLGFLYGGAAAIGIAVGVVVRRP
jgi:hypothetical protein